MKKLKEFIPLWNFVKEDKVKIIIARPMLGIPIMSIRVKIPSMIRPNTLLTHPMMKVEFCVNKITSIYSKWFYLLFFK